MIGRNLQPGPLDRRLDDLHPLGSPLARVFDDEDRILAAERDQEDEPDLRIEIVGGDAALAAT